MERHNRVGVTSGALSAAVRGYQLLVSPLLPPACRFLPTCSEYAAEAIERHGAWRGIILASLPRTIGPHSLASHVRAARSAAPTSAAFRSSAAPPLSIASDMMLLTPLERLVANTPDTSSARQNRE